MSSGNEHILACSGQPSQSYSAQNRIDVLNRLPEEGKGITQSQLGLGDGVGMAQRGKCRVRSSALRPVGSNVLQHGRNHGPVAWVADDSGEAGIAFAVEDLFQHLGKRRQF